MSWRTAQGWASILGFVGILIAARYAPETTHRPGDGNQWIGAFGWILGGVSVSVAGFGWWFGRPPARDRADRQPGLRVIRGGRDG